MSDSSPERRRYDSPVRRERMAETRERIVAAGAQLLHGFPVWRWNALTVRAVARRARVSERTVYRHFASERELREAVFERTRREARVELDAITYENLPDVADRVLRYVASIPVEERTKRDETQL